MSITILLTTELINKIYLKIKEKIKTRKTVTTKSVEEEFSKLSSDISSSLLLSDSKDVVFLNIK